MASLLDDIKKANQKPSLIDEIKAANKPKTLLEEINDANLRPEPRSEEGTDSTTGFPAPTTTLTTAPVLSSPLPGDIRVALPITLERPPIVEPPPSWWERMKAGMELTGEAIAVRQEAEAMAGTEGVKLVLEVGKKLDKPANAMRVMMYRSAKASWTLPQFEPTFLSHLKKKDSPKLIELSSTLQALRDGWNQTDYKSYPDIRNVSVMGPELEEKWNRWIDRHPTLKAARFADEFASEFIIENLAEAIVFGAIVKPIPRALATRTVIGGKVGFKVAPKWTAKQCVDLYIKRNPATVAASRKGFTDWLSMQHHIKHPKVRLDDLIRENLDRPIESLTRPLTDWPAKPTTVQMQELADLYGVKLKVKPGMDNAGHYDIGLFKGTVTLDESLVKTGKFPVPGDLPYTLNETYLHEIGHNVWFRKLDKTSRKSFSDVIEKLYITDDIQDTAEELFAITFYQLNAGKINNIDLPVLRGFNDVMKQAGLEKQFTRNMNQVMGEVMGEVLYKPDAPGVIETLGKARTEEVGKQLLRRKGAKLKGKPTPRVAKQASAIDRLVDLKQKYIKTLDDMADLDDRIVAEIDPKIIETDAMLRHMDSDASVTPAQYDIASKRLDALYIAKQHVLDTSESKWLAAEKIKTEIAGLESGTYINWEDITREIRGRYIDDSVAADVKPKNFGNQVKEIADAVSLGRLQEILGPDEFKKMNYKDTLPYLSDNEFMAAFDYIEIMKKAPADFKYATKVKPVLFGKEFAKPRRYMWMPFYDWFTPARLWYERSGVPQIPKAGRQALTEQTRFIMKTIDGWEEALKPLGGKKITKDLPTMKRIFHIANGDFMEFRKLAKDAGLSNKKIADEFNAGRYISGVGDEMYEMWEASGRWPAGLKREKFYIRNIVDWTLEDAATDNVRLGQIAALQERGTFTKININEFRNRILKHDLPLVENADTALRMGLYNHTYKYHMEPAFGKMKTFAELTGNEDVVTYTRRLINYGIRGESTPLERFADRTVFNNIAGALEKGTSILPWEKFHFHKQDRASKQLLNIYRRAVYAGTMGFNPGPIAKNVTQQLLNIPLTNTRSWFWGQQALFTEGGSGLSKHCDLIVGRVPFEDFDPTMFSKVEKLGSKGFRFVDKYPNVLGGFNANCIYLATRDDATRNILKRYGDFTNPYRNPNRAAQAISNAFDAGELKWLKEAANSRTTLAQYDYTAFGQPMAMIAGGPVTKAVFQFGTWPANYFYGYLPELFKASMTGIGPNDIKLGMFERQVYLRHFLSMEALSITAGTMGIDMEKHRAPGPSAESPYAHAGGAAPTGAAPFVNLGVGLLKWSLGWSRHDERMVGEGKAQMRRGLPFFPPVVMKKAYGVGWEDKPLSTLLFKLKKEEKSAWSGREPGAPSGPSVPTP